MAFQKDLYLSTWLLMVFLCCIVPTRQRILSHPVNVNESRGGSSLDYDSWKEDRAGREKRYLLKDTNKHWPKGIIPYKFHNVDDKNGKDIFAAMSVYEYLTPIRFVPWQKSLVSTLGHPGFIHFEKSNGRGWSLLGFYNDKGGQGLNCPNLKTCIHEMGHALGFAHEQANPNRDKWIRVNIGKLNEYDTWERRGWAKYYRSDFDISTVMLYGQGGTRDFYEVLFSELEFEPRYFYMFKELCHGYRCDQFPQCKGHGLTCANQGFVSVVDGRCACVCVRGFDPNNNCKTMLKTGPPKWPKGTFSLLQHKDGCPDGSFQTGLWRHYGTGENIKKFDSFKGALSDPKAEFSFCSQTTGSTRTDRWPLGAYCFLKQGTCPDQRGIHEAKFSIPGRADTSQNMYRGVLPTGSTGQDATWEFCCVQAGFHYIPASFPAEKPFILFALEGYDCQQVAGMHVKMEKFGVSGGKVEGSLDHSREGSRTYLHYCVYTPLNRDCGGVNEVGPNRRTFTIQSSLSDPAFRQCNWLFKNSNIKGTFSFSLDEFSVSSSNVDCTTSVEVQPTKIGQKGTMYCGDRKDRSTHSLFSEMLIRFTNGGDANAHFKATVEWIPEQEMCYDLKDNGWSYRGSVDYTRKFESCIPWSEATSCPYHPYLTGHYLDGLEKNYCRNPDGSFRPWCYTKLNGCMRDYCDVCKIEKPFDLSSNCTDRKGNGQCTVNDVDCAKTCDINQGISIKKGSDVHCNRPGTISGGSFEGPVKQSYNLGDTVTFKCTKSGNVIERKCMSTGKWTEANTACLPCPQGYIHFQKNCYKFHYKFFSFDAAVTECRKDGDLLAMPKTKDENDFIVSMRYPLNLMWIGVKSQANNGQYKWSDGTAAKWLNWKYRDVTQERCVYLRIDTFWKSANECDWRFNFVCQKSVTDDKPNCHDFLDNCPSLISSAPSTNCDMVPGLNTYCRYSCGLCPRDCDQTIQLSQASPTQTISSDRRHQSHRYCTWTVKAPNKNGRIVLRFQEFQVKALGSDCVDSIEVRQTEYGAPYTRYCDTNHSKSLVIKNDQMFVAFRTPGSSRSHFKATVTWVPDSDMCYNVKDKGTSYDGKVNYTRTFQACLPWSEALTCVNNTIQNGYGLENLEDNYCRNPDHSAGPWCYNDECEKSYCDVCHLESPSDTSSDCQKFKSDGKCSTDLSGAATECAETCKVALQGTKIKASSVTCPRPGSVPNGVLAAPKNSYKVGKKVRYTCQKSQRKIKRTCLTSGTWSTANTACIECPFGFIPFKQKCYKFFKKYAQKAEAQQHCQKLNAVLATPKNEEENDFVSLLRGQERIWLGAHKGTDTFLWNDGTKFTWPNWKLPKKSFSSRDLCMVLEKDKTRTDDWCVGKLFYYVCQDDRRADQADCTDYLDICSSLLQSIPESNCAPYPSLQLYCRSSCGLCSKDCSQSIQLSSQNPTHTITRNSNSRPQFCTWEFDGDDTNGRYIVTLDEFLVNSPSSLTIKLFEFGKPLHIYSEQNYQKTTYIRNKKLLLVFKAGANSNSKLKATVKWVRDSDMCYDVKDKGWSYKGKVNYTKDFQACLSWAQALSCPENPLKTQDFLDHLDGNYCRNPDQSDQPWCYTNNCQKQDCDVCHLEKPTDRSKDCSQRKSGGTCTKHSIDCAKTCDVFKTLTVTKVSDIKCRRPGRISGGSLQGVIKSQYNVGEKVVYKCTKSSFPVERVCLSNGDWSVDNTACLECPVGYSYFQSNCFKYVDKPVDYKTAVAECHKEGSLLAMPKSKEINSFLYSLRTSKANIWLGAQKNLKKEEYYWDDNTPFSWTNFDRREPFTIRDTCVYMKEYEPRWNDDWCHDKAFNFICQKKADDEPDCKDFLDNCPHLLSLTNKKTCGRNSPLELYCRRTCGLCPRDCDHDITLTQSNPTYVVDSDRRHQSHRYCSWHFKGDTKHGRFTIQFDDFDVKSSGKDCEDVVEISQSKYGSPQRYCNGNDKQFIDIVNDEIFINFRTLSQSGSHIKASIKWIDDSGMCYDVKDKGWSYNGKVNYTATFQPCLAWSQALKCPNNPLKEENFLDNLDENYCRNPDGSDKPWCYVKQCEKQYCDVCHLEKPIDGASNCASFKRNGECTKNPKKAITDCAATCKATSTQAVQKVRDISCGRAQAMPGGIIQGQQKQSYSVGDKVTYKCSKGPAVVDRACLSSGDWSVAKTACLECPVGWVHFKDKCYRHIDQFVEYYDAVYECKKLHAIVATPKTTDVGSFVAKYCPKSDKIWIGAQKKKFTDNYYWTDGTLVTKTFWRWPRETKQMEDCVKIDSHGRWFDDWCNDKFYSFVCQMDSDDNPECIDFVDTCPKLIQLKRNKQCDSVLNKFCRKTCGKCTIGG